MAKSASYIGVRRRVVQGGLALLYFLPPWLHFGGFRTVHFDLDRLTLTLLDHPFRLEDTWLFLLLTLLVLIAGLLVTMTIGRVWCGWACPQTLLTDLVESVARPRLQHSAGAWRQRLARHALSGGLALCCAVTLVWYFIPPDHFFVLLPAGELPRGAVLAIAICTAMLYLDLAFVGRLLCKEFCPYGRIQAALADRGTLMLHFPAEDAARCIDCQACVRTCPMEIDIRRGEQIACINCGRCLDACRRVMTQRDQLGIIRYDFGSAGEGVQALLNPRLALLSSGLLGLTTILLYAVLNSANFPLAISRTPGTVPRWLDHDRYINFFTLSLSNRTAAPLAARLRGTDATGREIVVQGPGAELELPPHSHRRTTFAAVMAHSGNSAPRPLAFRLESATTGEVLARTAATASPPEATPNPEVKP